MVWPIPRLRAGGHVFFAGAVALVAQDVVRPGPGLTGPGAADLDGVHDLFEEGPVGGIAAGENEAERAAAAVEGQMDFRRQSASGSPEGVITYFAPPCPAPHLRAPAEC